MNSLLSLLHFAGGTFPTGGFSQSWGLETYIYYEKIKEEFDFCDFLGLYVNDVLGRFEGPFFSDAYDIAFRSRMDQLVKLEETLSAMRLTRETREMSVRTGKAFCRIASDLLGDEEVTKYYREQKDAGINLPIAFAVVAARLGVEKKDALRAYFFNSVNGLVQSGIKSISLGNTQAQKILFGMYDKIDLAAEYAAGTSAEEAVVFCPGLDIASMRHETLPTRLYMT